jgi:predicted metal-binding membrane protein
MNGMPMPQQAWYGDAAGFLEMWMVMMVPMMLPTLIPMLSRYRRSVRGAGIRLHGLTALVGVGYYFIWVVLGAAISVVGAGLMAMELRWVGVAQWVPAVAGALLLVAGGVQLTSWKARHLVLCREGAPCDCRSAPGAMYAWQHGLRLGVRCSLCSGSLILALLAIGMMDLVAMAAVTLAIAAERLAPFPLRVARVAGVAILVAGVVTIARI